MGSLPNASELVKREVISLVDNQRKIAIVKVLSLNLCASGVTANSHFRFTDDLDRITERANFAHVQYVMNTPFTVFPVGLSSLQIGLYLHPQKNGDV